MLEASCSTGMAKLAILLASKQKVVMWARHLKSHPYNIKLKSLCSTVVCLNFWGPVPLLARLPFPQRIYLSEAAWHLGRMLWLSIKRTFLSSISHHSWMWSQSFCWVWCKKHSFLCMNVSALVHSFWCQFRFFWFRNQKKLLVKGTFVAVLCITVWRIKYWRKNITSSPAWTSEIFSDVGQRLLSSSDTFENITLHPNKVKEQPIFGVSGFASNVT